MNLSHACGLKIFRPFFAYASNLVSHYILDATYWITEKEPGFLIGILVEIFGCLDPSVLQLFFISINI